MTVRPHVACTLHRALSTQSGLRPSPLTPLPPPPPSLPAVTTLLSLSLNSHFPFFFGLSGFHFLLFCSERRKGFYGDWTPLPPRAKQEAGRTKGGCFLRPRPDRNHGNMRHLFHQPGQRPQRPSPDRPSGTRKWIKRNKSNSSIFYHYSQLHVSRKTNCRKHGG